MSKPAIRGLLAAICLFPAVAWAGIGVTPAQVYNLYLANPGNAAYRLTLTSFIAGTDTSGNSRSCNVLWFDSGEPLATQRYSLILAAFLAQKPLAFNFDPSTTLPGWCHVVEAWVSP
jgi:hypothetical protein